MTFAYIENGIVADVAQVDPTTIFAPDYARKFIAAPAGVQVGWLYDGQFSPPPPKPITVIEYTNAVQEMLDAKARERNYDGILSACTYATSTNPKFSAEGTRCVQWRDDVWAECYTVMAEVEAGHIPAPTIPGLLAMLPTLTWPA